MLYKNKVRKKKEQKLSKLEQYQAQAKRLKDTQLVLDFYHGQLTFLSH